MPFLLPLLGNWKLIAFGVIALFVAGLWLRADYLSNKLEARERTIALREAEIASIAEDANRNAAAAARIRAEWQRADAATARARKDLANAQDRLKAARNAADAIAPGKCGASERIASFADRLRQPGASADHGSERRNPARGSTARVAQSAMR